MDHPRVPQGLDPVRTVVEAAVETFAEAMAAQEAGARRVELCAALSEGGGGWTPSAGTLGQCLDKLLIPVHVLVRPRGGDFVYDAAEIAVMRRDIVLAKELGADGVAIGALTADGHVDAEHMADLIAVAHPMRICFHRAFDRVADQDEALELLVSLQVDLVLTSGGAPTAVEGMRQLKHLVERADGRIGIVGAGKVTAATARELVTTTGVREVHARAFQGIPAALNGEG